MARRLIKSLRASHTIRINAPCPAPCPNGLTPLVPVNQTFTICCRPWSDCPTWMERLVAQQGYFVIHAPRQTGKTTAMLALAQQLTASSQYTAVMLSAEVGAVFPHDPDAAETAILGEWYRMACWILPPELHPPPWQNFAPGSWIAAALGQWAQASPRPFVICIDEIDVLQDQALLSVLRQLRSGYPHRPQGFTQSLALIGLRDVRDYEVALQFYPRCRYQAEAAAGCLGLRSGHISAESTSRLSGVVRSHLHSGQHSARIQ
jgi:hypothetical protein